MWESADPTSMLLPPLPNFLFQRDPSCWIYDGVTINPMTKPARKPETMIMEAIYRFHPMFAAEEFPIWLGGADEDWGRAPRRGRRRPADRQRHGDDRHGRAHDAAGRAVDRPRAVPGRLGDAGARRAPARSRAATCTSTPSSRCATATSSRCSRRSSTARAPGRSGPATSPDDLVVEEQTGSLPEIMAQGARRRRDAGDRDRRRRLRGRARAVGRRQQRRRARARRRRRLRAQHRHQHRAAQGRHRGHHHRGLRARPRPRRLALHDLPARARRPRSDHPTFRQEQSMSFNLRNRSFVKEIDFEPRELRFLLQLSAGAEDREVRGHRGAAPRRQGDRADLREDLDAHAGRVRGRGVRPGRARHLPRSVRVAAGPQGVDRRHRAGARPHVRRASSTAATRQADVEDARASTPACPSTTA